MNQRTIAHRTRRDRKTRPSVVWMDRIARTVIAVGGVGTILAVGGVCVFLAAVVVPLFLPASISEPKLVDKPDASIKLSRPTLAGKPTDVGVVGRFRVPLGDIKMPAGFEASPSASPSASKGECEIRFHDDGRVERLAVGQGIETPFERLSVFSKSIGELTRKVTAVAPMVGNSTWIVGDSAGSVSAWFLARPESAEGTRSADGRKLVCGHRFERPGAAVTCLAASTRGRIVAIGYADGLVRLIQVTAERVLVETRVQGSIHTLGLAPKNDGLYVEADRKSYFKLTMPHPDISLASLFLPIWYEGYPKPELVWQSSGSDAAESKLSLLPLIFGTIKATFYSMLFGAPLAFLAAIYTSQFLGAKTRALVKPTLEFMASLPSVVLGFIAALLIAPWVEDRLVVVLCMLLTMPFALLVAAHVWQLLPDRVALRAPLLRFLAIVVTLPIGIGAAFILGPWVERVLFGGDVIVWLDARHYHDQNHAVQDAIAGWLFPSIPISACLVAWIVGRWINPLVNRRHLDADRQAVAMAHAVKFAVATVVTAGLAASISYLLGMAFDPRGIFVDTYDQRNSLVVGFVMGFAVIPIIYTVADDALGAVPDSLKSASLGAGATQWQTTIRIVVPAAVSGLFSAFMIGLGRAVGETLVVLMAAGNTPIMQWNIFNGFRTLSANIAVEIPEAVKDSTHYRTLFLAALVLFGLTFVLNTVAELVRRQFRKRAMQ